MIPSNPYSDPTIPDYYMTPPPPPPNRWKNSHTVILALVVLLMAGLGTYGGIVAAHRSSDPAPTLAVSSPVNRTTVTPSSTPQVTSTPQSAGTGTTPTPIPTATLIPTVQVPQYTVMNIYQDITSHLDSHHKVQFLGYDTNWKGWPYIPGKRAVVWLDTTPDGTYTIEVAMFLTPTGTQEDYLCWYNQQCTKESQQGNLMLSGTYQNTCFLIDNNYNANGSTYSDYIEDIVLIFDQLPECS